ncbi:MAG: hypothetical protein ACPHCI_09170 [Solirubrobacterales bacterium]
MRILDFFWLQGARIARYYKTVGVLFGSGAIGLLLVDQWGFAAAMFSATILFCGTSHRLWARTYAYAEGISALLNSYLAVQPAHRGDFQDSSTGSIKSSVEAHSDQILTIEDPAGFKIGLDKLSSPRWVRTQHQALVDALVVLDGTSNRSVTANVRPIPQAEEAEVAAAARSLALRLETV